MIWLVLLAAVLGGGGFLLSQIRIFRWKSKQVKDPLVTVSDPMEAAAVVMTVFSKISGPMRSEDEAEVTAGLSQMMGLTSQQSDELFSRALWLIGDRANPEHAVRSVLPLLKDKLASGEAEQLIASLETQAAKKGEVPRQTALLADLKAAFRG